MKNRCIPVTKPYLPPKEKYKQYVDKIYKSGWLTNRGPLVQELETRLVEYLGVKHVVLVANGSLALQVAYKTLDLKGEVITTPFSFAATASTVVWEGLKPVFCDVDEDTFNLDPHLIEPLISENTSAILPVHVFGNPCDVELVQAIADKHDLKVIYDAAHAFGVKYKGESVLKHGDISTLSFHATKLFHTIEGGALITECDELAEKARSLINFGITGPDKIDGLGINAKMNEFEAAMGLCVLDDIDEIISNRICSFSEYKNVFEVTHKLQQWCQFSTSNGAYFPILFGNENKLLNVKRHLEENGIYPRRYFHPSLDEVGILNLQENHCLISQDISKKILCLPIYYDLHASVIKMIKRVFDESI